MVITHQILNDYKSRISEAKRIALLDVHIPDRLRELVWCATIANLGRVDSGALPIDLRFGEVARCRLEKLEWISFPAFDVGIRKEKTPGSGPDLTTAAAIVIYVYTRRP